MRSRIARLLQFTSLREMATKTLDTFFGPPASVRGMRSLDEAAFRQEVVVPGIRLPLRLCAKFLQRLRHVVLKYPGVKKFVDVGGDGEKVRK